MFQTMLKYAKSLAFFTITAGAGVYLYRSSRDIVDLSRFFRAKASRKMKNWQGKTTVVSPITEFAIRTFIDSKREGNFSFAQSFLYHRGVNTERVLSLREMRNLSILDIAEGWVQIKGDPTISEINSKLKADGLEFPIDIYDTMPYLDVIHLNEYGFSALKYGCIRDWIGAVSAILPTGDRFNLTTAGVPNAHGANLGGYFDQLTS